jgi:hypothetical protein
MNLFLLILVSILGRICFSLEEDSFLTAQDFQRADQLSDEELDRGVGDIKSRVEFNPELYEGDIVKQPWMNRKNVSIHTIYSIFH